MILGRFLGRYFFMMFLKDFTIQKKLEILQAVLKIKLINPVKLVNFTESYHFRIFKYQ